jgi:hypothetical protein
MNVDSCLRRPSSKERQSSKLSKVMHNLVRVEEKKVVDDKPRSDNGGISSFSMSDESKLKWFKFSKKLKIRTYTFVV